MSELNDTKYTIIGTSDTQKTILVTVNVLINRLGSQIRILVLDFSAPVG